LELANFGTLVMTQNEFQEIAGTLPQEPGIYKYYNEEGELLYVGKAKNIRKRVSSYFTKSNSSYKTHELVRRIRRVEFTIVHTEQDAFLLENSLIKQYQPMFNIELKDDKTYPVYRHQERTFSKGFSYAAKD
jgi:excinuclease ABC subunit C